MLKKLFLLLMILWPGASWAQTVAQFNVAWDADSTTLTYCRTTGQNGNPFGQAIPVNTPIETSGSSTTVTAVTALTVPFDSLAVGDVILVQRSDGTTDVRIVDAKASGDSITVDTAVNWDVDGGFSFRWLDVTCGTTDASGWIDVSGFREFTITGSYDQGDLATGLELRWECKTPALDPANAPIIVYPGESDGCGGGTLTGGVCRYATAGIATRTTVAFFEPQTSCRVGVRISGADASDATTNRERVNVSLRGER